MNPLFLTDSSLSSNITPGIRAVICPSVSVSPVGALAVTVKSAGAVRKSCRGISTVSGRAVRRDNVHGETASCRAEYVALGKRRRHLPGGGTPIIGHLQIDGVASLLVYDEVIVRFAVVPDCICPATEAALAAVWAQ